MRILCWMIAIALVGAAPINDALGQGSHSRTTTSSNYNTYYSQEDGSPSPSDAPPPVAAVVPEASSCDGECGGGCDSGCDSSSDGCSCYAFGPDEAIELYPTNQHSGIKVGGWFQVGYHNQQTGLSQNYGDVLAFNDVPDQLNLQQSYLYIEKQVDTESCDWNWGFRGDILYGTDAQKTQAFGGAPSSWDNSWDNGVYGWAIPQAYVEIGRQDLSIKIGRFYTPVGYEVVTAPGNFFYSRSLTAYNSEPFTHTGALASYKYSDRMEIYGGYTLGWDTGFETFDSGSNFIGGFSYAISDRITMTYINTFGDFGARGNGGYSHSLVFDVKLTDRLNYVFQSDYLQVTNLNLNEDEDFGINQYLLYRLNDCLAVGGRIEWWSNDSQSFYEATAGINYKPHANITIRPEIRQDWSPGANVDKSGFAIDAIFTF